MQIMPYMNSFSIKYYCKDNIPLYRHSHWARKTVARVFWQRIFFSFSWTYSTYMKPSFRGYNSFYFLYSQRNSEKCIQCISSFRNTVQYCSTDAASSLLEIALSWTSTLAKKAVSPTGLSEASGCWISIDGDNNEFPKPRRCTVSDSITAVSVLPETLLQ